MISGLSCFIWSVLYIALPLAAECLFGGALFLDIVEHVHDGIA